MLLLVVGLFLAQGNLVNCVTPNTNKTGKLIEKIRRQLMENNYDYSYTPSKLEILSSTNLATDVPNDPLDKNNYSDKEIPPKDEFARRDGTELFAPINGSEQDARRAEQTVSKKDLLYYVDDERLKRPGDIYVEEPKEDFDEYTNDEYYNDENSTPKYKVMMVKSASPYRRSLSYQRFVQAQEPDGVALISLDGAPFPEFHLPHGRRQYMPGDSGIEEGNVEDGNLEEGKLEDEKLELEENETTIGDD